MKFLQIKPQVLHYDLHYTIITNRDENEVEGLHNNDSLLDEHAKLNAIPMNYIHSNDVTIR